jgi:DNA-directed RNA polymerase subunit RPC12/RpoP
MKCLNCGHQNPNNRNRENKCNECGYYLLSVKRTKSEQFFYFHLAQKIFVKAIRVCCQAFSFRKGFNCLHLLLIIILAAIAPPIFHGNRRQFDRVVWQSHTNDPSPENPRSQMLGDLQRQHLRIGMTKQQVHHLLGSPEQQTVTTDIYRVGEMGLFSSDPAFMELRYNNDNILLEIKNRET